MEDNKRKEFVERKENDIVFSKAVKAGKRIYYLDVKRNKRNELYLSITESKKLISGTPDDPVINFEKHKIFLYKEDFEKFADGFNETIAFVRKATIAEAMQTIESEEDTFDKF